MNGRKYCLSCGIDVTEQKVGDNDLWGPLLCKPCFVRLKMGRISNPDGEQNMPPTTPIKPIDRRAAVLATRAKHGV